MKSLKGMPIYNDEKYVKAAIKSILNQTLDNLELIIVNDGSTARSKDVILQITDSRIKFIDNQENRGRSYAVNCGFEVAKEKNIAEMDADDISLPDKLFEQYRCMEDNPKIACCGTLVKVLSGYRIHSGSCVAASDELHATMLWHTLHGSSEGARLKKGFATTNVFGCHRTTN